MNLFAYGTLIDQEIMARVSGVECRFQKATLPHYVRKTVRGEVYPAIARQEDHSVDGVVYFDVSPQAVDRLDKFEGPLYVRTDAFAVCDDGTSVDVQTYVIASGFAERMSDDDWSYGRFLKKNKDVFQRNYRGYKELDLS